MSLSLAHDILTFSGTILLTLAAGAVDWRLGCGLLGTILLTAGIVGMLNARKSARPTAP